LSTQRRSPIRFEKPARALSRIGRI